MWLLTLLGVVLFLLGVSLTGGASAVCIILGLLFVGMSGWKLFKFIADYDDYDDDDDGNDYFVTTKESEPYSDDELARIRDNWKRDQEQQAELQRCEAERQAAKPAKPAYKKRLGKHWPTIGLLNRPGDSEDDTYLTYLAGARHYIDANERCGFVAIALPEPNNEYNPDAVVVWTIDKKIGYIPDDEVDDFNEWTGRRPVPCLGTRALIDGKINTTLIAIRPANPDFIRNEVERAVDYIKARYGDGMLPPDFEVQCKYADGVTPINTTPDGTALAE